MGHFKKNLPSKFSLTNLSKLKPEVLIKPEPITRTKGKVVFLS